jgi:hypothetical protein
MDNNREHKSEICTTNKFMKNSTQSAGEAISVPVAQVQIAPLPVAALPVAQVQIAPLPVAPLPVAQVQIAPLRYPLCR